MFNTMWFGAARTTTPSGGDSASHEEDFEKRAPLAPRLAHGCMVGEAGSSVESRVPPNKGLSVRTLLCDRDRFSTRSRGDTCQGFPSGCVEASAVRHLHRGNLRTDRSERAWKRTEALSARVTLTTWGT